MALMKHKKKVELLAPAGNREGFLGAIHAGADAVYLGGKQFGARAYADNFSEEELITCIKYAHLWGRKAYLTVNTLTRNQELERLYDYLLPFYRAGLDGVIIQDMGVFQYVSRHFPGLELHVSTQMTITDVADAAFMKEQGAARIVPARELSLDEIKTIKEATNLEMECFIHGAMCYAYSGQCLFSSILGGRSGNRGRCAQPCRLPYQVTVDGKKQKGEYPLSLKDMCTLQHIPQLIEAGIDSFKIEGRMKKPEYTAGVTAIYRKYIDEYYGNREKEGYQFTVREQDLEALSSLYIRSERQDGYYFKHNGGDMVTLDSPSYSGTDEAQLANIRENYIQNKPKLPVSLYAYFQVGQPAVVCLTLQGAVMDGRQNKGRSLGTRMEPALDITVSVEGSEVSPAQKQPMTRESATLQLSKLGNTIFEMKEVDVFVEDGAFYPVKELNELRRRAVAELEQQLIAAQGLCYKRAEVQRACLENWESAENFDAGRTSLTAATKMANGNPGSRITLVCQTWEQLETGKDLLVNGQLKNLGRLILEGDLLLHREYKSLAYINELGTILQGEQSKSMELYIALPYIIRKRDTAYMQRLLHLLQENDTISGVLVRSLSGLAFLKKNHYTGNYLADGGFYLWNKESIDFWKKELAGGTLPYELNSAQQRELLQEGLPLEKLVYGRLPMMISAGCVVNTTAGCHSKEASDTSDGFVLAQLTDRYQKQFPVQMNCSHCYNIIYNSLPLSLHKELPRWYGKVDFRLHMTTEKGAQTREILLYFDQYLNSLQNGQEMTASLPKSLEEYTTGHEKRGAE